MARDLKAEHRSLAEFLQVDWATRYKDKRQPVREIQEQAAEVKEKYPLLWAAIRDAICEVGGFPGHPDPLVAMALCGRSMAFHELERLANAPSIQALVGELAHEPREK